jgi:hypothetical protein
LITRASGGDPTPMDCGGKSDATPLSVAEQNALEWLALVFLSRGRRVEDSDLTPDIRQAALARGWIQKLGRWDTHYIPAGALADLIGNKSE